MSKVLACLVVGSLLACTDRNQSTPGNSEAPATHQPPAAIDTALVDTLPPDTVMARDTAQSNIEY